MKRRFYYLCWINVAAVCLLLTACQDDSEAGAVTRVVTQVVREVVTVPVTPVEVTRVVEDRVIVTAQPPTATPVAAEKELTVCMVNEPPSLYYYSAYASGTEQLAADAIRHAVYENLYTTRSFGYQAQGLTRLPSVDEGDAVIDTVTVAAGDTVWNANGVIVQLAEGDSIVNAGGETVTFTSGPVEMAQLRVRFELQPLIWSDGTPVSAEDSVFSFNVAADPLTPVDKTAIERTASYTAVDELSVEWVGVPGWIDPTYFTNIWPPLPRHQLLDFSAAELLETPEANFFPLSSGPFVVEEWRAGDAILLRRNPFYYRAADGLPRLDVVTVKFVPNSDQLVARLISGECNVATQDGLGITRAPLLLEAEEAGLIDVAVLSGRVFEHIDFGINTTLPENRPVWFADANVRRAITLCTDRQRMVDELIFGLTTVADSYLPPDHPVHPGDLTTYPYDSEAGRLLLDEAGFLDRDQDGVREEPRLRIPVEIQLEISAESRLRRDMSEIFVENMADCGIQVTVVLEQAADLFETRGIVFGRRFELVSFPWLSGMAPVCELFTSEQIPTPENNWRGNNNTGWSNAAFDAACAAGQAALWGSAEYEANHVEALRQFTAEVPIIPLFFYIDLAATTPTVQNFGLDPTQPSGLWNLFEIDIE